MDNSYVMAIPADGIDITFAFEAALTDPNDLLTVTTPRSALALQQLLLD